MLLIWQLPSRFGKRCLIVIILYMCFMMAQNTWHIVIILYLCVTTTQSTLTHCYHLISVLHNDTKYIDTLLSSYTCVSQWHKVHRHIAITLYLCVTKTQSTSPSLISSYTCVYQWHIVIILYMCVTMTQSIVTYSYHIIPVCTNDTKYSDTLLSSYTCVSQWHKVLWHIVII